MKNDYFSQAISRNRQMSRGFTAIELLVASALAGLMTVAVMGVLGLLSKQHRELLAKEAAEPWQLQFKEQVRWDFANARQCQFSPVQLRLTGFGGRDFTSGAVTHCPAEVAYMVKEIGNRRWLVRRETHPDDRSLRNYRQQLVCGGIDRIEMQPLDQAGGRRQEAVPARFRLKLQAGGEGGTRFDEVIRLN